MTDSTEIVGLLQVGRTRDGGMNPRKSAEIYAIHVAPHRWRQGIGRRLCEYAEEILADRGFQAATLWVRRENRPARSFWEAMGFAVDGATETHDVGWFVGYVRYRKGLPSAEPYAASGRFSDGIESRAALQGRPRVGYPKPLRVNMGKEPDPLPPKVWLIVGYHRARRSRPVPYPTDPRYYPLLGAGRPSDEEYLAIANSVRVFQSADDAIDFSYACGLELTFVRGFRLIDGEYHHDGAVTDEVLETDW